MKSKIPQRDHGVINWDLNNPWCDHNSVQLNQQVYWVIQVIPYVSKGRSHRDCWYEASYGHLVNLS